MLRYLTLLGPQYPDLLAPTEHTPGAQSGLIHPRYLFHTRSPTAKITRGIRPQTLPIFGHAYLENTKYMHEHPARYKNPPEKTLFLVFPHPNLPQKNLIDIVEFLSLHHLNALLLTPGINLTKLILPGTKYPTYNLGPLKTLNWPSLPDNLKQKNYPLIAIHLNTPYHP